MDRVYDPGTMMGGGVKYDAPYLQSADFTERKQTLGDLLTGP